jgi:hypothetical protein
MSNKAYGARDRGLGWLLRAHYDGLARQPLPKRWTELIRCLDDQERLRLKAELSARGDDDDALTRN